MAGEEFPGRLSPFRVGFLRVQLFIGGAWVDVLTTELGDDGVTIVRGRGPDARQGEPSRCSFRVKDPLGKWNNRHPSSPYAGQIGRGTPLRIQVQLDAGGTVRTRWQGKVTTWQPRWTKTGAADAYVEVEAAGTLRRLGRGTSPLRSPLRRAIASIGTNLVAYWPLEDSDGATQLVADKGGRPIVVQGAPSLSAYAGFAASAPIPTLQDGRFTASPPSYTPTSPATAQVRWVMRIPSGTTSGAVLLRAKASGTLGWVEVRAGGATALEVEGFNDAGASVGSAVWGFGTVEGRKLRASLELTQSGANISVTLTVLEVGAAAGVFNTGSFAGVTLGAITQLDVNPNRTALGDVALGHLSLERVITSLFVVSGPVLAGYVGERADDRIARLCAENGLTFELQSVTPAQLMGAQGVADLLTLLRECEATDGGMLYEPRNDNDIGYRTGASLLSQTPVVVPYQDNLLLPFEPVEDDESIRNDVTVTRAGGSQARFTQTAGALGTLEAGVYDDELTLSLASDADALGQAAWAVHLGTHDEQRWPVIGVDLAHPVLLGNLALRDALLDVTLGARLDVTDVPAWVPPFELSQLTQGYTEVITPHHYKLAWNCAPARPYRVARWTTPGDRWSAAGTVLAGAGLATTTGTTFTVTPPAGTGWTHRDGDYFIVVRGEVMLVTDVVNGTDFTVVRAVNGVARTHPAGALLELADPVYYGL